MYFPLSVIKKLTMVHFDVSDLIKMVIADYIEKNKSKNTSNNIFIRRPQLPVLAISESFDEEKAMQMTRTGQDYVFPKEVIGESNRDVWRIQSIISRGGFLPIEARLIFYYWKCIHAWDWMRYSYLPLDLQFNLLNKLLHMEVPKRFKIKCFQDEESSDEESEESSDEESEESSDEESEESEESKESSDEEYGTKLTEKEGDYWFSRFVIGKLINLKMIIGQFKTGKSDDLYEKYFNRVNQDDEDWDEDEDGDWDEDWDEDDDGSETYFWQKHSNFFAIATKPSFKKRIYGKTPDELSVIKCVKIGKIDSDLPKYVIGPIQFIILI